MCREYVDWRAEKDAEAQTRRQKIEADAVLAVWMKERKIRYAKEHNAKGVRFSWLEF